MSEFGSKKWENIIQILIRGKGSYKELLTDDELRIRIQFITVYALMGFVALFMTLLNFFQEMRTLGFLTMAFFFLSVLNAVISMIGEKAERFAQKLFGAEMIGLFTTFAVTGNPDGFSILWTVLLPTLGFLLYRRKEGMVLIVIQWLILIFLFWTGTGRSLLRYSYSQTFLIRFPILYVALAFMGLLFENLRRNTQEELARSREEYEYLYNHDALTGLFNRYGFNAAVDRMNAEKRKKKMAFAIMDLDGFKTVNDTYGHLNGDRVLQTACGSIRDIVGDSGIVCRWGGEEIAVLFSNAGTAGELCRQILEDFRNRIYRFDGRETRVTVSIGLVLFEDDSFMDSSKALIQADGNLYQSKKNGKDRMTVTEINETVSCGNQQ